MLRSAVYVHLPCRAVCCDHSPLHIERAIPATTRSAMTAAAGGGAPAVDAAAPPAAAAPVASPAAAGQDSEKAAELRRLHTELGAFVPE